MKNKLVAAVVVASSLMLPLKATASNFFSELYVFGDSLSDTGNVFNATGGALPAYTDGDGRFSNGPVWVEYLAEDLGLTPNPSTNFAFAASTTGSTNLISPLLPGLEQQIDIFTAANPVADPDALYTLWAGANDYLLAGITDPSEPLSNLSNAVTTLAGIGAQNIMVFNLADMGMIPATANEPSAPALSALTELHNNGLTQTLNDLSQNLLADVNLIHVDAYSLLNDAINNPASFGLTNVTDDCLSVGCTNPDEYLFWDTFHPTTKFHEFLGDAALDTLQSQSPTSVPEPTSALVILAFGALAVKGLKSSNERLTIQATGNKKN